MGLFDNFLNIIPGASLIQRAVNGEQVTPSDFVPGSRLFLGGNAWDKSAQGESVGVGDFLTGIAHQDEMIEAVSGEKNVASNAINSIVSTVVSKDNSIGNVLQTIAPSPTLTSLSPSSVSSPLPGYPTSPRDELTQAMRMRAIPNSEEKDNTLFYVMILGGAAFVIVMNNDS